MGRGKDIPESSNLERGEMRCYELQLIQPELPNRTKHLRQQ